MNISFSAIVIAAVLAVFIGWMWYSQWIFGIYRKELVENKEDKTLNNSRMFYILSFIVFLISAFVLSQLILALGGIDVMSGIMVGVLGWMGFVLPSMMVSGISEGKKRDLILLDLGYYLISFIAMGAFLAWWPY